MTPRCAARRLVLLALLAFAPVAAGCGGGGGAAAQEGGGPDPTPNPGPDVVVVFVSGHSGLIPISYLEAALGPYLSGELRAAGYTVETRGYADRGGGGQGYDAMLEELRRIRDAWVLGVEDPTHVVLVAHSHGGVWAHAATRAVDDLPFRALVDLDVSSVGWGLTHSGETDRLDGSPQDAYEIPVNVSAPDYPDVPSEPGFSYDLEDVVFPNVRDALEVVSGAEILNPATFEFERYDERWNARLDGSLDGLDQLYSATGHTEVALPPPTGTTFATVKDWLLLTLAN